MKSFIYILALLLFSLNAVAAPMRDNSLSVEDTMQQPNISHTQSSNWDNNYQPQEDTRRANSDRYNQNKNFNNSYIRGNDPVQNRIRQWHSDSGNEMDNAPNADGNF